MLLVVGNPFEQRLVHLGQVEKEVLGLANLQHRGAADFRARVFELKRVVDAAAVVALIPTRVRIAAIGAFAFDVTVCQKLFGHRVIPLALHVLVDKAGLPVTQEHLVGDVPVIGGVGVCVQIKSQPHRQAAVDEKAMILFDDFGVGDAFGLCFEHDRRAVRV